MFQVRRLEPQRSTGSQSSYEFVEIMFCLHQADLGSIFCCLVLVLDFEAWSCCVTCFASQELGLQAMSDHV